MNRIFENNSLYTNIVLSKKAFLEFYKSEIDELFKTTTSEIFKRNIHIESYDDFLAFGVAFFVARFIEKINFRCL